MQDDPVDITESIQEGDGFPATDRVYSYEGRFFKVRLQAVEPPPGSDVMGMAFFRVSGSETDNKGYALPREGGWRIAQAQVRTIMSHVPVPLADFLENIRVETVLSTKLAADLQDQFEALKG